MTALVNAPPGASVPLAERLAHPLGWLDADPRDHTIRDAARARVNAADHVPPRVADEPVMCRRDCQSCRTRLVHLYGTERADAIRESMPLPPDDARRPRAG